MNKRGLASFHNEPYEPPHPALSTDVMYFAPLVLAPSDRREVATHVVGVPNSKLSVEDKVLNICLTYMYGPSDIYHTVTGKSNPAEAHVDFTLAHKDPDYIKSLHENVAYARQHGFKMWTTTELHTSIQTAARNYCRKKHNDPTRAANSLDLVEWLANMKYDGTVDRILSAKTLEGGYNALTSVHGIGPYFGYNSILMIANLRETEYTHEELFCAPGGGAIKTLEYLFEPARSAGLRLKHGELITVLAEHQHTLFPNLSVPDEFQNLDVSYGKLLKDDQTFYTCNSFEVGCCQFSVYRKFVGEPAAAARRPNPPPPDLTPFREREAGRPMIGTGKQPKADLPATNLGLLSFD